MTVARRSCDLSPGNFGKFTMRNFCDTRVIIVRLSYDGLEKTWEHLATIWREKIKLSDICSNVVRHFHECLATVIRIKISYIRGNVVRNSHECLATVTVARYIFPKLDRNWRICRINVHSMRLQHENCVYIVNLCREIVVNFSCHIPVR